MQLKFKKLHPKATIPKYQTAGAAGFDLCSIQNVTIFAGMGTVLVRTGLAVELPKPIDSVHFELQIRPRSGLTISSGLIIPNSPGTIDEDYRGEIKIPLRFIAEPEINKALHVIMEGERIAQGIVNLIVIPEIVEVDELSSTDRGAGGFGSTGA